MTLSHQPGFTAIGAIITREVLPRGAAVEMGCEDSSSAARRRWDAV